jgi:hypothetical protein
MTLMLPNYFLIGSSLLFIIPATIAELQQFWVGYYISLFTTIISSMYHATNLRELAVLVELSYILCAMCTFYTCMIKGSIALWCIPAGFCALVYYGGYLTKTMVWDPDQGVATTWHVIMHIVSSGTGVLALSY